MQASPKVQKPLAVYAVDLDDTLIKTDLLYERILQLLLKSPGSSLLFPWYALKGPLALKKWLKSKVEIDYAQLPYRNEILERVRLAREHGEKTILISASLQEDVEKIGDALKVFDECVGSKEENLKGAVKASFLKNHHPEAKITYVGDSSSDIKVWNKSNKIIAVNPSNRLKHRIGKSALPHEYICDQKSLFSLVVRQIRVHQWLKNILVFAPVFLAHRFQEVLPWVQTVQAFFAFSFLASTVYVFNDLCDLKNDRTQASKKHRPLASGDLPLKTGMILMGLCFFIALGLTSFLAQTAWVVMAGYLVLNIIYSFWVKEWLAIDVVFLSLFYSLRILAGGTASNTPVSEWLLSFSVFFFFGLAMIKRYAELKKQPLMSVVSKKGRRAYEAQDLMSILVMGISTSILSILVLALYLSTGEVQKLYGNSRILWLITPILLYWVNRLWLLGVRGEVTEDPVIFAIKDKLSWLVGGAVAGIIFLAL